jgi:hypothetical protein
MWATPSRRPISRTSPDRSRASREDANDITKSGQNRVSPVMILSVMPLAKYA